MPVISISQAVDGLTAVNAASLNTNFNTITNVINGNLDANNLANGAVTTQKLATGVQVTTVETNPYKFRVYQSSALGIATAATTKIPFDTKNFDTSSNFDVATNHRFVAPLAGFYQFNAMVSYAAVTGGATYNVILTKNNSIVSQGAGLIQGSGTGFLNIGVSDCLQLAANDYIEVFTTQTSGGTKAVNNSSDQTYFSGFLVSAT